MSNDLASRLNGWELTGTPKSRRAEDELRVSAARSRRRSSVGRTRAWGLGGSVLEISPRTLGALANDRGPTDANCGTGMSHNGLARRFGDGRWRQRDQGAGSR